MNTQKLPHVVIVGAGFGGKHSGEAGVEAARLAQAANKPVSLRWTREEEFTWAYFRPAALIHVEAGVDEKGGLTSWHFINVNSGGSGIEVPYRVAKHTTRYIQSKAPLRHGSYRALASTANNFAREVCMDELAIGAGLDPLEFRLAHLEGEKSARLRAVLETAAQRFNWSERAKKKNSNVGVGLACGTEVDAGRIRGRKVYGYQTHTWFGKTRRRRDFYRRRRDHPALRRGT